MKPPVGRFKQMNVRYVPIMHEIPAFILQLHWRRLVRYISWAGVAMVGAPEGFSAGFRMQAHCEFYLGPQSLN